MNLASVTHRGRETWGAVTGGGLADLGARVAPTLAEAIAQGLLGQAAEEADRRGPDLALEEAEFLPPIPRPGKIVCIGVNYQGRDREYDSPPAEVRHPSVFMRTRESLVGHLCPVLRPPESEQYDYEGEIAMVVGKGGRRIRREDAAGHVAGLTLMNEGSVRDWMRHGKFNVTQGKNFAASGSAGPWMTTADSVDVMGRLSLVTRVNGEVRQSDHTGNLMFPFDHLVSYLSVFMPLHPGDVIATGTPSGAGVRHSPPRFLVPGDVVEVEVDGIGTLRNPVRDETP